MIFRVELGHIQELLQLELARLQRRRRADCRGVNFSRRHRGYRFSRSPGLNHRNIPFRLDAVGAQGESRSQIGERSEASRAEYLALQILHSLDARPGKNRKEELTDNRSDDDGVSAGEIG